MVVARHDPRRCALEQLQTLHLGLDRRHELDRRGAGADHRHSLAAQNELVIPSRRVEDATPERTQSREVGNDRIAELAVGEDQLFGAPRRAAGGHGPTLGTLVPRRSRHVLAEDTVRDNVVPVSDLLQVRPDLALRREGVAPVRVLRERELVEQRLNIAGASRITVLAPRPPESGSALEDHEVADPACAQADRHADAGEPTADDHDADATRLRHALARSASAGGTAPPARRDRRSLGRSGVPRTRRGR